MATIPVRLSRDSRSRSFVPAIASVRTGLIGVSVALAAILLSLNHRPYPLSVWLPLQCVGLSFLAAGMIGRIRRPDNRAASLMIVVGITWYIGDLQTIAHPVLFALGFCLFYVTAAAFTHLILALPTGRLEDGRERWLVIGLYAVASLTQVMRYVSEEPVVPQFWGAPDSLSIWAPVGSVSGGVLTLAAFWLVLRRWLAAGRPARRRLAPLWSTGAVVGGAALALIIVSLARVSLETQRHLLLVFAVALILMPFAILTGLLRVRLARLGVANLVMHLESAAGPRRLRDALADALGDATLQVWFRLPGGDYADVDGRVAAAVPAGAGAATPIERGGEELAILVHDPALLDQIALVRAVVAAAGLALDNARLQADLRVQLDEVRASRTRIVAAADDERRRIQRDLHDGAQHALLATALLIGRAQEDLALAHPPAEVGVRLGTAAAQLQEVIRELRDLTEGINPPALTEQGIAAVMEAMAERAPIPLEYTVPSRRWPDVIERTLYFVIHESLTNVYKHARATRAAVSLRSTGPALVLEVRDDGIGGADAGRGSGMRGLRDRVAAVGGALTFDSAYGGGTLIRAELPCG
jgi:signal transduction histidine kinase